MIKTQPLRTSQWPKPFLAMRVYGDTMYGVHITIGWCKAASQRERYDIMTFTTQEMLGKLRHRLERYLR